MMAQEKGKVMTRNPKIRITRPKCRHKATGFVGWPPYGDPPHGAHASTHCCNRETCIADAAFWVEANTGHRGVYTAFATFNKEES